MTFICVADSPPKTKGSTASSFLYDKYYQNCFHALKIIFFYEFFVSRYGSYPQILRSLVMILFYCDALDPV